MSKIPTAEEFWKEKYENGNNTPLRVMIEFAQLHVKAALKSAYKNQGMSWTNSKDEEVKLDLFIKNSYPKELIKMSEQNKQQWWGYKHTSGTYQAKRYWEKLDIQEAIDSPFCDIVVGPFLAADREDALRQVQELTS